MPYHPLEAWGSLCQGSVEGKWKNFRLKGAKEYYLPLSRPVRIGISLLQKVWQSWTTQQMHPCLQMLQGPVAQVKAYKMPLNH